MTDVARSRISADRMGRLIGLESSKIGFYSDVKQKIQELEATNLDLRTKKNELEAVFAAIRDGVLIYGPDGRIQFHNQVCPTLLPGETALGKTCSVLFHPEHPEDTDNCPVEGALRGEFRHISFSLEHNGSARHFEAVANPIRDAFGRPSRALLFLRDVTARRQQELKLFQAEKMSSVGVLAAGVAHEINNPLTSVAGYAEALLRRFKHNPKLGEEAELADFPSYLEVIVREAHRCKGIIDSLLRFSRRSDGSFTPVHLEPLCREVLQLLGPQARQQQVELTLDADLAVPAIRGDAAGLRQVILNLTLNALQAIEGRGQIKLEITPHDDRWITLRVSDSGCGIPHEVLEQIWDPFFTTKEVGQGLGLGLSITYDIVRRHGGHIQVDSQRGKGSTFTVFLPEQEKP